MKNTMKIAAITGKEKIDIREVKMPVPSKDEVLIKVKACALCTWEQRVFLGIKNMPFPFVGGHEVSGEIVALGEGVEKSEYPIGQRVAVRTLETCGKCYYCRQGKENLCSEAGSFLKTDKEYFGQGGLGEFLAISVRKVFKFSESLPYTHAAFAEPVACVVNSVEQGKVELGNDVVIIGAGIMGLLHAMISKLKGARVIVSEPDMARRNKAKELGVDVTFSPLEEDFVEKIKTLTEGRGADVVFNTTAIPQVAEQAVQVLGKLGRVVMYSSINPDKPISVSPNWIHSSEVEIIGAVSPTIKSFQTAVMLLSKEIIKPDMLISKEYPLEKTQSAFKEAIKPDTYRIIITND